MDKRQLSNIIGLALMLILGLSSCNLPLTAPESTASNVPNTAVTETASDLPTPEASSASGMQIRFVNVIDGGTIQAKMANSTSDLAVRPMVILQVEVTGSTPLDITLTANGLMALDESNHISEAANPASEMPFTGELHWSPINGAGDYTLIATAMDSNKQTAEATVRVIVSGVPLFTPSPPPLDQAAATLRITQIIQQEYGVNIPAPSIQWFDFPDLPSRSRWISAAYYKGQRYYIELYDDTHYDLSPEVYADPTHPSTKENFTICKPVGLYKILVVYVDYGNLTVDKADALAQVPVYANWTNQLYDDFTKSQGYTVSPLNLQAIGAWISPPPSPGHLLTSTQILAATGIDPSKYNFIIEIDLDRTNTVGTSYWKGVLEQGGGIALQGCGAYYDGNVNIFSVEQASEQTQLDIHGVLEMDFNHELGHLFGMMDSWPFKPGSITSPDGQTRATRRHTASPMPTRSWNAS